MKSPPFVSPQEWETAREQMLVKEKAFARARDALAAERRRMPWVAVEKAYMFDGPEGKASLLAAEKDLTRRSDDVARLRQQLPWVRGDKNYTFDTEEGRKVLKDLFGGRSQFLRLPLHVRA